jgi:hypothetical protein
MVEEYNDEDEGLDPRERRIAPAPGNNDVAAGSQMDILGVMPGTGSRNPLDPLFEGEQDFELWSVRGKRSAGIAAAEVEIFQENDVLLSDTYPARGDHLLRSEEQMAYKTVFSSGKKEMNLFEFGGLLLFGAAILGMVFLIGTVYAP